MFMPSMESFRALQPSSPSWLPEDQIDHFKVLSGGGHVKQQENVSQQLMKHYRGGLKMKNHPSSFKTTDKKKLVFLKIMVATCTLVETKIHTTFLCYCEIKFI